MIDDRVVCRVSIIGTVGCELSDRTANLVEEWRNLRDIASILDPSGYGQRSRRYRHPVPDAAFANLGAIWRHASRPATGPRRKPAGRCCPPEHATVRQVEPDFRAASRQIAVRAADGSAWCARDGKR
jgi:hypothetical protein